MHETTMLVIYFPYINRCPWELRKTELLAGLGRYLQSVLKTDYHLGGCVLSQLCKQTWGMDALLFGQLCKVL